MVTEHFTGKSLLDQLFGLSALGVLGEPPDPEELKAQAQNLATSSPLLSLVGTDFLDRNGKTIHRSPGMLSGKENVGIERLMGTIETERRQRVAMGVEAARIVIAAEHYVPEESLLLLMLHSPFVPPELTGTYTRGFLRFLHGDFTSATYILVPLLESSFRHVLKQVGVDVSKFYVNDATQEDKSLSSMFETLRDKIEGVFGKALAIDIENVFLKHPGPRLRHNLAHGQMHDGSPYGPDAIYGCWLIFRLCVTPLHQIFDSLRESLEGTGVYN